MIDYSQLSAFTDMHLIPTNILFDIVCSNQVDQSIINNAALELTYRLYIPEGSKSFEDLLLSFGYVKNEDRVKRLIHTNNCIK